MSDIFICYSRTDQAIATKLRERLQTQGWSVFMDLHIDAGHRWSEEIESALAAARAVLTLWSTSSVRSRFVKDEAHEAAERGIIFPARIEDVRIPYGFRELQTADLIGWDGDGDKEEWRRTVATLRKHLGSQAAQAASAGKPDAGAQPARVARARNEPRIRGLTAASSGLPAAGQKTFRDKLKSGGEGPLMVVIPAQIEQAAQEHIKEFGVWKVQSISPGEEANAANFDFSRGAKWAIEQMQASVQEVAELIVKWVKDYESEKADNIRL